MLMEAYPALITAIGGAIAVILTAFATLLGVIVRRQADAHKQMNSRLDELIASVRISAGAEGFQRGREAARAESAADDDADKVADEPG